MPKEEVLEFEIEEPFVFQIPKVMDIPKRIQNQLAKQEIKEQKNSGFLTPRPITDFRQKKGATKAVEMNNVRSSKRIATLKLKKQMQEVM